MKVSVSPKKESLISEDFWSDKFVQPSGVAEDSDSDELSELVRETGLHCVCYLASFQDHSFAPHSCFKPPAAFMIDVLHSIRTQSLCDFCKAM